MAASDENAPKLDRRVVRTRKAIQTAFRNLVVRQGAEKITVSALAREADIDRKTFYLHYASLDELAEEQGHLVVDRITQVLVVGREPDGITVNLRTVVTELAAMFQEDPEFYRRVARELSVDSMVEALCEPVRQAIVDMLKHDSYFTRIEEFAPEPSLPLSAAGAFLVADRYYD